jgi:malonyl CoA-acyl carrier protein transacylase
MPGDDLAESLACQLTQPVLFAQALARAADRADLIVVTGPEDDLAELAADYAAVPCVAVPGGAARVAAALFAAGAISDVRALTAPATEPEGTLPSRLVPRMRDEELAGARTSARSG